MGKEIFSLLPYGKQFLVRTDNAALSYLLNFADCSSRLMRWSLRLSKFDFFIDHKAGTKISHFNDLRRHVGAIMEDSLSDKERFLEEQKSTPSVIRENQETTPARANIFLTKMVSYTECPRRKGPNFGKVFLRSNYNDITKNTYIQSSMVTEILAREV